MVTDCETVRLIPNTLEEVERWGVPGEAQGSALAREVDLLLTLGEGDHSNAMRIY